MGDLVLLKDNCTKPTNYPMPRIKRFQVNDLGEVTGAIVQKGSSGKCVKRRFSTLIPLLRMKDDNNLSDAVACRCSRG